MQNKVEVGAFPNFGDVAKKELEKSRHCNGALFLVKYCMDSYVRAPAPRFILEPFRIVEVQGL